VQVVNDGEECEKYKQWSDFFYAQVAAAREEGARTKLQALFGIRHRDDTSYMVGLTSAIQILKDYQYHKERGDFSDIYVVFAHRGDVSDPKDLCSSVEMSFLAVTSANVPVVLHMGINRTLTFLLRNNCDKISINKTDESTTPEIKKDDDKTHNKRRGDKTKTGKITICENKLELSKKLAVELHMFSAQFFATEYGDYPEIWEYAKNSKAKKYIVSRPAHVMRRILMQDERMRDIMYVSDAMCNTEFGQDDDTLSWYNEHGSPVQDFETKSDDGVEVIGCSFYNRPVERHQEKVSDSVFEIARWEITTSADGKRSLNGFVCGAGLSRHEEMRFLAYGDASIRWLPYICFPVRSY
jgi:hypothetical protein